MKKSFTLIELLISIVILSILFLALSNVLGYLRNSADFIKNMYKNEKTDNLSLKVLYYDLLNADKIELKQKKNYTLVTMQTSNSLYFIPKPYVMWYVSKNGKTLMRCESATPIKITYDFHCNLDKFVQNVKIFKIYKNKDKYFIYIDNGKPIYFEMYKGN